MQKYEELLLALMTATVNHDTNRCCALLPADTGCWERLLVLAEKHGVTGLVFSCMELLPPTCHPDKTILLKLFGNAEYQKRHYRKNYSTAARFAAKLKENNVEMKVLKGISFSTYYNQPELRVFGDCDCYLTHLSGVTHTKREAGSSGFNIGNEIIKQMGGKAEFGTYKHSHLFLDNLMFENHHYITDFNNTLTGIHTEQVLDELMQEEHTNIGNSKLRCPSANFNALFLLKYAQGHFINEGIRMRHVLDWALFLRVQQEKVDWLRVLPLLETTRTAQFAGVMTAIASKHLRIDIHHNGLLALTESAEQRMVDAVLADIMGEQPAIYVDGLWHKTKRILRCFYRMWKLCSLASESYPRMVRNAFAFSSYLKRKVVFD